MLDQHLEPKFRCRLKIYWLEVSNSFSSNIETMKIDENEHKYISFSILKTNKQTGRFEKFNRTESDR